MHLARPSGKNRRKVRKEAPGAANTTGLNLHLLDLRQPNNLSQPSYLRQPSGACHPSAKGTGVGPASGDRPLKKVTRSPRLP